MKAEQPSENSCLICIIGRGSNHPKRIRYYSEENIRKLFQELKEVPGSGLLYYRRFNNTFDALAHKLMFEHLSDATVNYNIKAVNKECIDLLPRLIKELGLKADSAACCNYL